MAAGDFHPARVKRCRCCGALGEFPGFLRCCPACEEPQLRLPLGDVA